MRAEGSSSSSSKPSETARTDSEAPPSSSPSPEAEDEDEKPPPPPKMNFGPPISISCFRWFIFSRSAAVVASSPPPPCCWESTRALDTVIGAFDDEGFAPVDIMRFAPVAVVMRSKTDGFVFLFVFGELLLSPTTSAFGIGIGVFLFEDGEVPPATETESFGSSCCFARIAMAAARTGDGLSANDDDEAPSSETPLLPTSSSSSSSSSSHSSHSSSSS